MLAWRQSRPLPAKRYRSKSFETPGNCGQRVLWRELRTENVAPFNAENLRNDRVDLSAALTRQRQRQQLIRPPEIGRIEEGQPHEKVRKRIRWVILQRATTHLKEVAHGNVQSCGEINKRIEACCKRAALNPTHGLMSDANALAQVGLRELFAIAVVADHRANLFPHCRHASTPHAPVRRSLDDGPKRTQDAQHQTDVVFDYARHKICRIL